LLQHHAPDAFVRLVLPGSRAFDLKHRGGLREEIVELVAGGSVFEVLAVLSGEEWEGALQIRAQGKTRAGNDAVSTLSKRREDAQKRGFGRMKERIVRPRGQIGDGFENLLALTRQACGDIGG
jgi:hypothetical protein